MPANVAAEYGLIDKVLEKKSSRKRTDPRETVRSASFLALFFAMLRLESGKHGGLVSKPVEAIRKDQQGGSPQPDKNAKALGMRLFLDTIAPEIPPDKNRKENREYPPPGEKSN